LTTDATTAADATTNATTAADATPAVPRLDAELKALRNKAGRICDELASLYRRMEELQRQIEAHQQP